MLFAPVPQQDIMITTLSKTGSTLAQVTVQFIMTGVCLDLSPKVLYVNAGIILTLLLSSPSDETRILETVSCVETNFSNTFIKHYLGVCCWFWMLRLHCSANWDQPHWSFFWSCDIDWNFVVNCIFQNKLSTVVKFLLLLQNPLFLRSLTFVLCWYHSCYNLYAVPWLKIHILWNSSQYLMLQAKPSLCFIVILCGKPNQSSA